MTPQDQLFSSQKVQDEGFQDVQWNKLYCITSSYPPSLQMSYWLEHVSAGRSYTRTL